MELWEDSWTALLGAYDVELADALHLELSGSSVPNISLSNEARGLPTLLGDCDLDKVCVFIIK
jgi:hypothetical protein